jgi:hypothetical protein
VAIDGFGEEPDPAVVRLHERGDGVDSVEEVLGVGHHAVAGAAPLVGRGFEEPRNGFELPEFVDQGHGREMDGWID